MTTIKRPFSAAPLADLIPALLDDVLQKRAGLNTALIGAWPEIAGEHLGSACRPMKISWSRAGQNDDAHAPATLHIAAEPQAALRLQHETGAIIARVNAFFGYAAIDRVRIMQSRAPAAPMRQVVPAPTVNDLARADDMTATVEDEALRAALNRLGAGVLARRRAKG
jgi:hypothetical protein